VNSGEVLYLKDSVKFEPSVFSWPAWPQIIQPVTAALNLKNRYFKILESYLEDPNVHYTAANDPNLIGGPFINVPPEQSILVEKIFSELQEKTKNLIQVAKDIGVLNSLVLEKGKGYSLEPLYDQLPKTLRGMVELSYDLNNLPHIRLIEPLVYKKYYNPFHQSILVSEVLRDFRPFVLSTPYVERDEEFKINRSFNDPLYDDLFCSRFKPIRKDAIENIFETNQVEKVLNKFFQVNPPAVSQDRNWDGNGVRVRYFGHACVLIETQGTSILVDPLVSYHYPSDLNRYTFGDLPDRLDYVLFTHAHEDHIVFETILQIRHKVGKFVIPRDTQGKISDPSIGLILSHTGFKNVISLEEFQTISSKDCEIMGLPFLGEHCDVEVNSKLGYYVNAQGHKMLFLADSNNLDPVMYEHIFDEIGAIDILFIGMEHEGGPLTFQYGGLITVPIDYGADQSRRLSGSDYHKAAKVAQQFQCRRAYVYAMGQEPWLNHLMALNYEKESPQILHAQKFVDHCKSLNIDSELLFCKREWNF
jgi:L-ascorbate metabolism protein UlaG (beta-lactamase superfamily)